MNDLMVSLDKRGLFHDINSDDTGTVQCITWTTESQLRLLEEFPDIIMMDGTYKVSFLLSFNL